jgi:WD40 repeat protein
LLISGGSDGQLRWWEVDSGQCVRVREAHQGTIHAIKVSSDGIKLASCGDDGAIHIWELERGEHLRTLRRDRPYERLNITGIQGLTQAEIATLRALGAVEDAAPDAISGRNV